MLAIAILALIVPALAQEPADQPPVPGMVAHTPELTDEVLLNPGMGLYMQHPPLDLPEDHWMMSLSDIAYYRCDWSDLNPEEDIYTFDEYFGPRFDCWVKQHGKRLAFRVMCENTHSRKEYVTPKWVFDRGVPGVEHRGIYAERQINPVFWDQRYLDIQCEFIRRLGEYLDGREGIEFMDIGSIGEWGEMHLGLHMDGRWTPGMLEETGFTHTGYVMAYRQVIDAFTEAFPKTPVFLNVGGPNYHTINDYAALRGTHFRQDGLNPAGASNNVGEWLYKPYSQRGVMGNFEFHSGYKSMVQKGWDLRETINSGLDAPISYLNTNLGTFGDVPDIVREELTRAATKVGYRFVIAQVECFPEFHIYEGLGSRVPFGSVWRNDGIAPCFASYALVWSLVGEDGAAIASEMVFPTTPTTQWKPGEEQFVGGMIRLPDGAPEGSYRLSVSMIDPETSATIKLGIAGRDDQGRYALCEIAAVPGQADLGPVYQETFEKEDHGWGPAEGMAVSVDQGRAHTGEGALIIQGVQNEGWNYAVAYPQVPIIPCGRYRLTLWLAVDRLEPGNSAPYIKIGVSDREGKWLENYSSARYDTAQMGTWQKLTVTADLPASAGSVHLAVEKGAFNTPIEAALRIDDVTFELLEGP